MQPSHLHPVALQQPGEVPRDLAAGAAAALESLHGLRDQRRALHAATQLHTNRPTPKNAIFSCAAQVAFASTEFIAP